ncbi:MAG: hypothetical protein IPI67_40385 [Myxococcales bacterium]|nr:hypothetical protein [Myxococcales bacterium]
MSFLERPVVKFALFVALASFSVNCTETPVSLPLRSLERSGEVSFVCADREGVGYDINSCPDFDSEVNPRHLFALVTQTLRGEVAVVDLSAGKVVDLDSSTPGFRFIPVGKNPIDIVSTPGGVASFVGVADVGKEGIFAIPTRCARPPAHDLVAWPACALPSAPGEMAIVIDPPAPDNDGDSTTPAPVRASCDAAPSVDAATPGTALAATRADCAADLALEKSPAGRRKLLVTLPEEGGFAVIDAQALLDREPGSFKPCDIERFIKLEPKLGDDVVQKAPSDLQAPGCVPPEINYGPVPDTFITHPGGIEVSDGRLFVADRGAPVVHVVDVSDPCSPRQDPPLRPVSYENPNRIVTTSQVAVSPPTSKGQLFAYAIDEFDGSVMIFDVTPGTSNRTPIVRPGSPRLPFEPPDRIAFGAPARDVGFALRDVPIADPETGIATIGTSCDPDPTLAVTAPAAKYRPNFDYTRGAAPRNLRGVFGFVMLSSGQVAVVDIEDYDAPCRRPITTNSSTIENFRGCLGDAEEPPFFTLDQTAEGKRTVSGELSCRVVEQHRARSGRMLVNAGDLGVNAPSLRGLPRLGAPEGGNLATDQSDEGRLHPKVLAVEFPKPTGGAQPVEVHVGTSLYKSASSSDANPQNALVLDPKLAERLSVGLVLSEPRAFGGDEELKLVYEGSFVPERKAGFPAFTGSGKPDVLKDADANFCGRGVQDMTYAESVGQKLGVPASELGAFARRHADLVQVTQSVPSEDSSYWKTGAGAACGGGTGKVAYFTCREAFGPVDAPTELRDLRVVEAYFDRLVVEPKNFTDEADRDRVIELFNCCLGGGSALSYRVRAGNQWVLSGSGSGFRHHVVAEQGSLRCVEDCNPRRKPLDSRVFEVSASDCAAPKEGPSACPIGRATSADVACVLDASAQLAPGKPGEACIFQSLTHRFAVYRGNEPSKRDMQFSWTVTGGFTPLVANLAAQSRAVSPQSMVFVPQIGQFAVTDGASEGLVLVSLDSVSVSRLFF